ncbi:MAG TPA: septum formation initiator family protein [Candidatus Aphodomonas merdavium]|nr:septum formation initiator family protein [Candidatus Aphodomonas merdavium]
MARESWLNKKIEIRPRFMLLLLVPVAVFVVMILQANAKIDELAEQVERSQEQVLEAYSETEELERRIAFMDTDEYIIQEARSRYHLIGQDEIRFVLGSENSENTQELLEGGKRDETITITDSGLPEEQPVPTATPAVSGN